MVIDAGLRIDGRPAALLICGGEGCSNEFVMRLGDLRSGKVRAECTECRRKRRQANADKAAARALRAVAAREHADAVRDEREYRKALSVALRVARAALSLTSYELESLSIVRRKAGG